jgi:hypothetical protein
MTASSAKIFHAIMHHPNIRYKAVVIRPSVKSLHDLCAESMSFFTACDKIDRPIRHNCILLLSTGLDR